MPNLHHRDIISALPAELSHRILTVYLDVPTLCTASQCCKSWHAIINTNSLWQALCKRYEFDERFEYLQNELQLDPAVTPALLNPSFDHSCFTKADVCRFKKIFAYAYHARRNWRSGRYSVGPRLLGHAQQVTALGCTNRLVVTGSEDGSLNVYDLISAQLLYTLSNQSGQISQISIVNSSFNPRDDPDADPIIVTSSLDGHIRTFDGTFGMLQSAMQVGKPISKMLLFPNVAVVATSAGTIEFWSLTAQSLIERLNIHEDEIECLTSFGNDLIASGGWDKRLAVIRFTNKHPHSGPSTTANQRLTPSDTHRHQRHSDHRASHVMFVNQLHDEAVTSCSFSSEKKLVSGSADGSVRFWDVQTARCLATGRGHQPSSEVYCVACCAATSVAASGASDSSVCIWSLERGTLLRRLVGDHVGIVRRILIDAHKLVSASDRKRIVVWDYREGDGKQLQVLHREPLLVSHMWASEIRLVIASPEKPGAAVVLSFW